MTPFLTIEGAWEAFLEQSNLLEVTGGNPDALHGAKDMFMAGCQGVLYAFANIKDHCNSDGRMALPFITALYNETADYVEKANAAAEAEEARIKAQAAAWPFPTGTRQ